MLGGAWKGINSASGNSGSRLSSLDDHEIQKLKEPDVPMQVPLPGEIIDLVFEVTDNEGPIQLHLAHVAPPLVQYLIVLIGLEATTQVRPRKSRDFSDL